MAKKTRKQKIADFQSRQNYSDMSYEVGSKYWNDKNFQGGFSTARVNDTDNDPFKKSIKSVEIAKIDIVGNYRKAKLNNSFQSNLSKRSASVILQDQSSTYRVKL